MGRSLRTRKRVDYAKIERKYDAYKFEGRKPAIVRIRLRIALPGRAHAAPTITAWPVNGMHQNVEYFDDIDNNLQWAVMLPDDVQLPFANLDIGSAHRWQGLKQQVAMNGSASARAHFNAVTNGLRIARSNPSITECVGEAAAAIAMLDTGGWEMIWGFHQHAGTGIDQIWRHPIGNGRYNYLIVEAKGPGAGVNSSLWVPPNYGQMQSGWVFNHLYSMNQNNHAAGVEVCAALGLAFMVAHPNYNGATKSYYGLSQASGHLTSGSRLWGLVVTATWQADGRLGYAAGPLITYV
jgi:hypothetical protein